MLAMMSGLWYALPIAWAAYAFVYSNVIPYEEAYLQEQFGEEYQAYYRVDFGAFAHTKRQFQAL